MELNPYEAPREYWLAVWTHVCKTGVVLVVVGCAMFFVVVASHLPLDGLVLLAVAGAVAFLLGLLLLMIGGIGRSICRNLSR